MQLVMLNDAIVGWTNEEVPSPYKAHPIHEVNVRPIILAHKNVITGTEMITRPTNAGGTTLVVSSGLVQRNKRPWRTGRLGRLNYSR